MVDAELAAPGTEEERLLRQIDQARLPEHIAIIMDGNGRWARKRHMPRAVGHRAGVRAVRETVEVAARLGIKMITLYAFSRENWKRPHTEIDTLMDLLREYLGKELDSLSENNIRLMLIGRLQDLPPGVRQDLQQALDTTAANDGLRLCIALSYGGRTEIVDACKAIIEAGLRPDELDPQRFAEFLYTAGYADPDLLIRTSGELRVSNFLLWQIAYSEIWFTETLWPDFRRRELFEALVEYQRRDRRFGGLKRDATSGPAAAARG